MEALYPFHKIKEIYMNDNTIKKLIIIIFLISAISIVIFNFIISPNIDIK